MFSNKKPVNLTKIIFAKKKIEIIKEKKAKFDHCQEVASFTNGCDITKDKTKIKIGKSKIEIN